MEIHVCQTNIEDVSSDESKERQRNTSQISVQDLSRPQLCIILYLSFCNIDIHLQSSVTPTALQSVGGVHAFCMTRCTEAACKYSCAEGISWHSRFFSWWPLQLVATDAESKTASLLDTSQSVMVKCFMFEAVHALKGNNKHVFLQTITSKSTSRSQQLVAAVTRLNYCLCWTTGTPRGRHGLRYR